MGLSGHQKPNVCERGPAMQKVGAVCSVFAVAVLPALGYFSSVGQVEAHAGRGPSTAGPISDSALYRQPAGIAGLAVSVGHGQNRLQIGAKGTERTAASVSKTPMESMPASDSITFASDTSWDSFDMNSDGGMGDSLGRAQFVCLSCLASMCPPGATIFYHDFCGWDADLSPIPRGAWVWRAGVTGSTAPASLQGTYITKAIDIPGLPVSGQIFIAADDFAEISVNGVRVGSIGSTSDIELAAASQRALTQFEIGPLLAQGLNRIAIRAQNGPNSFVSSRCTDCDYSVNPAGVVFGGALHFVGATPTRTISWGSLKVRYR